MAKFLQETIRESGIQSPDKIKDSEEFKTFFRKVRSTGESPSTDDIVRVAKLFENDLTLDNLSRPQLVGMCRYMNINAFGTDNFLRYTLRNRLSQLKEDDKLIQSEGVEALSPAELAHAAASRGIRTSGVPIERLREELSQWINLHVDRDLSGTLLILSKVRYILVYTRGFVVGLTLEKTNTSGFCFYERRRRERGPYRELEGHAEQLARQSGQFGVAYVSLYTGGVRGR
jgi:hypothetical protein